MKSIFAVLATTCLLAAGAISFTGCNSSSGTTDKMQGSATGMEGKMTTDKMHDNTSTDKMTGDKMGMDKMTTDKTGK
jgi:hypothetical protein